MFKLFFFFFSSRRRHTRSTRDWSSDVCSSDLRLAGLTRNPPPCLPAVNIKVGLMSTGLADPRSESGPHQLDCQSCGSKKLGEPSVGVNLTTASLYVDPPQGSAFPVATKMNCEVSST